MKTTPTQTRLYIFLAALLSTAGAWVQPCVSSRRTASTTLFALESLMEPAAQQALQSTLEHASAVTKIAGAVDHPVWTSLLSTSLQAGGLTISPNTLQPAHEHVASWFGAADPYLAAGKSIVPSTKALTSMQIPSTSSADLPDALKHVLAQGWKLLDARTIQAENFLPGFTPTGGILPTHSAPPETPASFAVSVEWSARFLKVVDKLPEAALAYAMVEFFLLRPNIDLYKEEIRQEPGAVALETAVTTAVRVAAMSIVGAVTLGIFG
eukprot:scaffold54_cov158-Amphora_coffeaeformis.AAC.10